MRLRVFDEHKVRELPFELDAKSLATGLWTASEFLVVEVASGYLLGTNRGEWGGGVWYFTKDGSWRRRLAERNCVAIATDGELALLICELAHPTSARGAIHAFVQRQGRPWRHITSVPLPGAPERVRLDTDGSLRLSCRGIAVLGLSVADVPLETRDYVEVSYRAGRISYEFAEHGAADSCPAATSQR